MDASPSLSTVSPAHRAGFTLVEMSFVLVIVGLVLVMVYPAMNVMRATNQKMVTQTNLQTLMRATAAYVQANGCLPCPAEPGNTGMKFGLAGTKPPGNACGVCESSAGNPLYQGIVPFASLGLPQTIARDGWGHWITMRVDPTLTSLPAQPESCGGTTCAIFVPPWSACADIDASNGVCAANSGSTKGFCRYHPTSGLTVRTPGGAEQPAAVVFISHGTTGYGSYNAAPKKAGFLVPFSAEYPPCVESGSSAIGLAQCNSAQRDLSHVYDSPSAPTDADPFDHVLAYADRNTLVSMLGTGACNTRW